MKKDELLCILAINSYNGEGIEHGTTYTIFKQIIRLGKSARVLQNGMLLSEKNKSMAERVG